MPDFHTLEPAIVPNGKPTFLLDWEITMRCNLDCSYCETGTYGGHDNSTKHPPLEDCLKTIDFMLEYVNIYMQHKSRWSREVILNVYGGESLFHPDIVEIHRAIKEQHQRYDWPMTVTTTTNLIVGKKLLARIMPHIDEFTASYHTEAAPKQKEIFRDNLLALKANNKRVKVIILLHPGEQEWQDSMEMIKFCQDNDIRFLPRQLDHGIEDTRFNYNEDQLRWFESFYSKKSFNDNVTLDEVPRGDLADTGRACCGGRQVCANQDYKSRKFFVGNKFQGWSCSVNWFFLYIKQLTGEVFTNKDCKMSFDGTVSPIGHLEQSEDMIAYLRDNLNQGTLPAITCSKSKCYCGLCAPKAQDRKTFDQIMPKYLNPTTAWPSSGS
jgi:sulfatase maturation enzyme AslB (radical SAM superfamily)